MVRVPEALQKLEGAQRRFFEKESVAKSYVSRLSREMGSYQAQALGLTDAQKIEAAECFKRLAPINGSLRDAVAHYIEYREEASKSVTAARLVEEVLAVKRQDGASDRYLQDLKGKLGRFADAFSERLVSEIGVTDVEEWLRGLDLSPASRDSYRRNLSVAFELGRRRGYTSRNIVADVEVTNQLSGEVAVLTPAQTEKLLNACEPEIVSYVAVCAFAGLRPSEAALLSWSEIHLDKKLIEVKARHAKTRRHRLVPIQPNLAMWLRPHAQESGALGFSRRKFRRAWKAAGFEEWQQDVLRHSFGTYRLPIVKSAETLALEMGNSPDVIFRHYRRPMGKVEAAVYWKIAPSA